MAKKKAKKKAAKKEPLYTMVAGAVLEEGETYNVKCNCGGDAPIKPKSVKGYGYGKKSGAMKVVDQFSSTCKSCGTPIKALVIEGDPGYVATRQPDGSPSLFLPQGSTSKPVQQLTQQERLDIFMAMQAGVKKKKKKKK